MKFAAKLLLTATFLWCATGLPSIQAAPTGTQIIRQIGKVFVIAMENHNFTQPTTSSPLQISNNAAAPYINSLITPGNSNAVHTAFATKFYNAGVGVHPSEANYVWAEAGTDFGIHTDNDPSAANNNIFTAPHLTSQLNTAGISWTNYEEDVQLSSHPINSTSGTSGSVINPYYHTGQYAYAVKHNPMAFFTDTTNQNVVPLTSFTNALANNTVARYNWITPNLYNDQHTALSGGYTYHGTAYTGDQAAVAQGDNFLSILVPQIMASAAYRSNGIIIIRWDEAEGGDTTSYTIPAIIISPLAKGNVYASSVEMNHSSVLKTTEELFGLSFLANAIPSGETKASGSGYNDVATVNDLSDLLQAVPAMTVQQPVNTNLTNGVSTVNFHNVYLGANITNTFTLTNSGLAALNITNMTLIGANPGDFTVSGLALPTVIATNAAANFNVTFSPAAPGARSATLQIANNDPRQNLFTFTLTGVGLTNPAPILSTDCDSGASGFQLTFNASVGQHYRILASDDVARPLTNWTVVASGMVTASPVIYSDPSVATNSERFFRIVAP